MYEDIGRDLLVLNSITINRICDHMGDFGSFVSCYRDIFDELDRTNKVGDTVLLNFETFAMTRPVINTFTYVFGSGVESLKEQFIRQYPEVL